MGRLGGMVTTGVVPFIVLCFGSVQASDFNNRLNWVVISQNKLSTQIMFDFQDSIHFEHEVVKEKHVLKFIFPGMNLQSFNHDLVMSRLLSLKEEGFIKSVDITEKKGTIEQVILSLEFKASRTVLNENKVAETIENKFLVKWNTLDAPARLIIDIFPQEALDDLTKKPAALLHATNDYQQYDVPIQSAQTTEKPAEQSPQRIIIDPGHGGSSFGAKSRQGLAEKDITLDIAKRLNALLNENNYHSLLTRSSDKDVSLLERAQIAHQLKADLFVSIHVNSTHDHSENAWGVETFFLEGRDLFPRKGKTGFLFINQEKNMQVLKTLYERTQTTLNKSKNLALAIQTSIINTLNNNDIQIKNRGIKKEKFRVFLQTDIPSTLVEVGFLTNPKEADRLAKAKYRKLIAQGIFDGICTYLKNN